MNVISQITSVLCAILRFWWITVGLFFPHHPLRPIVLGFIAQMYSDRGGLLKSTHAVHRGLWNFVSAKAEGGDEFKPASRSYNQAWCGTDLAWKGYTRWSIPRQRPESVIRKVQPVCFQSEFLSCLTTFQSFQNYYRSARASSFSWTRYLRSSLHLWAVGRNNKKKKKQVCIFSILLFLLCLVFSFIFQ